MVETISHMSFSPLLNKTALCEIKAYTFKGDNGMSEKGAPLEASGPFMLFSYDCSIL